MPKRKQKGYSRPKKPYDKARIEGENVLVSKYGLKNLMQLSKDRGEMVKELNAETKSYDNIKKALDHGLLEKDSTEAEIRKKYGDPVITLHENRTEDVKWVYKPGTVSYFDEQKIYLVFNAEGKLVSWEEVNKEPEQ